MRSLINVLTALGLVFVTATVVSGISFDELDYIKNFLYIQFIYLLIVELER